MAKWRVFENTAEAFFAAAQSLLGSALFTDVLCDNHDVLFAREFHNAG